MATQVQNRRGTTAEHATFTGAVGEVTVDTTKDTVVVHDGSTAGGAPLLRENQSNLPTSAPTTGIYNASGALAISTNSSQRLLIDADGRLLVGSSSTSNIAKLVVQGTSSNTADFGYAHLVRGGNPSSGQYIGAISFSDLSYTDAVSIAAFRDGGTWGATSKPAGLLISTTSDGASSPTERLRVTSTGRVGVGTSDPKERLDITGGPILTKNIAYAGDQNSAYLIAGTTSYSGATTNWGTYGIQHRFKTDSSGVPRITVDGPTKELLCVTDVGRVGIGTSTFATNHVVAVAGGYSSLNGLRISGADTPNSIYQAAAFGLSSDNYITIGTGSNQAERARIDSSGRLLVGTSSARSNFFNNTIYAPKVQIEGAAASDRLLSVTSCEAGQGGFLILAAQRSGTIGGNTVLQSEDQVGVVSFQGSDGSEFVDAARIECRVDGTPGANDMPGRLVFSTTKDGQASPTEACRINSSQQLLVGGSAPLSTGQLVVHGTPVVHEANSAYGRGASTATVVKGRYDGINSITIRFGGNGNENSLLAEILIYGYDGVYMDIVVGKYYFLGQTVIRNVNSGGFSLAYSGNTNDWTVTITKSMGVPLVKLNATVGGINAGFGVSPTITFA